MTDYIQLEIHTTEKYHEILIAELFDLDFDGFEETDHGLIASIPANLFDDSKREHIEVLIHGMKGIRLLSEQIIKPQNWNENWEQSIQPQTIGRFYVTPTWKEVGPDNPDLITLFIDPKMAFGTGYHATTRLILEILPEVIRPGDTILDAGTGTGILGIAALKLGAESVLGFDIDEWSEINCHENISLNEVKNFEVYLGSTEIIPSGNTYDVILANINRNAIVKLLPDLLKHLRKGGTLVLSGLLETDESYILSQPLMEGMNHRETRRLQEWIAIILEA